MIVALGTIQSPAQENADFFSHLLFGLAHFRIVQEMPGGAARPQAADPLQSNLIIGLVSGNAIPDPIPVRLDRPGVISIREKRYPEEI